MDGPPHPRAERGAVAAEQVAVLLVVAAVIGAVWLLALPQRTQDAGEQAVDCIFATEECEVVAGDESDGGTPRDGGAEHGGEEPTRPQPTWVVDADGDGRRDAGDDPTGDPELDAVYEAAEAFADYLEVTFGHHGLDGDGAPLISAINDPDTANARWNGNDEQTFYAEGWAAPSVVHHEFGHGVVHYLVGLEREPENRALNEAIADIFSMNVTGEGTVGHDLPDHIRDEPIRVPSDPGVLGHPDHTSQYADGEGQHHRNSTIVSHAYHLLREEIGGGPSEQILYRAMTDHLDADAGFADMRNGMEAAAAELYGDASAEQQGVMAAFDAVGIDPDWRP